MYTVIFVALYLLVWATLAFLPWLAVSVATKGRAGLGMLALCIFAGVVAGLAVPFAGATGWGGLWGSFAAALLVPAGLLSLRRVARLTGVEPPAETRAAGRR